MKFPTQVHDAVGFSPAMRHAEPEVQPGPSRQPAPRRRRAGLLLTVAAAAALATALAVSSAYESRTLGERLDDSLGAVSQWGTQAQQQVAKTADAAVASSAEAVASVDTAMDDAAILARITTALLADPALQASRVDVEVNAGRVLLRGLAPTEADKERASSLARATEGVRDVDNQLLVAQAPTSGR